jgi:hypothetical protein
MKKTKPAKYLKWIIGDKVTLSKIQHMYENLNPVLLEHKDYVSGGFISNGDYKLIFKVEISVWNEIVNRLGLKCNKDFKRKREWRIA